MYRFIGLSVLLIIFNFPMESDINYDLFLKYAEPFLPVHEVQGKEKPELQKFLTPMEALDLVQEKYAVNFEKIYISYDEVFDESSGGSLDESPRGTSTGAKDEIIDKILDKASDEALDIHKIEYYYKLPQAAYYLVYEGTGEKEFEYIIHLYEFVLDEPETDTGHFVTYGWYKVNGLNGNIDVMEYLH